MTRLAGALALLAALALTGCEGEEVPDDTVDQNDQRVKEIVERLDDPAGGFTKFTGSYQDSVSSTKAVTVSAFCDRCRPAQVVDRVVEAVWQSEIDPILTIFVSVDGPDGRETANYVLPDDEAELTDRYGERPSH